MSARPRGRPRRRRLRYVQWSTLAAPARPPAATPGPGPSWLPCTRSPRPAARPASRHGPRLLAVERVRRRRLAEDVDPAGVRAGRGEHLPRHQLHVPRPSGPPLRAAPRGRRGRWSRCVNSAAIRSARTSCVDVEAVAALDLHRGRALGAHLGDPAADQPRSSSSPVARVAATVVAMPPAVVRLAGHPRRELRRPVAREHQVGCGSRRSRAAGPGRSRSIRRSAAGAPAAGPTRRSARPRPPRGRPVAARPSPSSPVPSQVTSSPMPVTTVVVTSSSRSASASLKQPRNRPEPVLGQPRTTVSPPTTTSRTSAAVAA